MNFFSVSISKKQGKVSIFPSFNVGKVDNLMVRGHAFYAIWDDEKGFWSRNEIDVARIVDRELEKALQSVNTTDMETDVKWMSKYSSKSWKEYCNFIKQSPDNWHELDNSVIFSNMEITKKTYATKQLSYPLEEGSISAYDQIMSVLYAPEERQKIEWAIGSIIKGDSKTIQKFLVLYGEAGTGKSTVLNILQKLFDGYYKTFEAKSIGSSNNQFSVEQFRTNPLIGIQHDGDLSRIEDNTKLNSIISHEEMVINEKYKSAYSMRLNTFLFMATNKPVKITDSKSGIIRRLIDVKPTGEKLPIDVFTSLFSQIDFELSGIAYHCLEVYNALGKNYYNAYIPFSMMFETDVFFNFVDDSFDKFLEQDGVTLKQAYKMYKEYCEETLVEYKLPMYRFREELKHYFREFYDRTTIDGDRVYKFYKGFRDDLFTKPELSSGKSVLLQLDQTVSLLDEMLKDMPAQYGNQEEVPSYKWANVRTTLKDLDTSKLHYVKLPLNHIVIDFDLKDENGKKDRKKNLEEAAKWPTTYAEFSKGGNGIHLHYLYQGDVESLSRIYSEGIEIKVFCGESSLRRKLSYCNAVPVAVISSGLPLKEKKMINQEAVKSERGLRTLILKNLRKEIHPGTKPSIDFIYKILEDAYSSGLSYDVRDLQGKVLNFAMDSTNHADYCVKLVAKMHFSSKDQVEGPEYQTEKGKPRLVFFDVEVYPNLFVICWKYHGDGNQCVRMINPSSEDVEKLFSMPLIGFNNRRYDNHILYARSLGYSNEELFALSKKIIGSEKGQRDGLFGSAYSISYTDIYDFAVKKQSLKKWEIELGIHHQEMDIPWDKPVPDDRIQDVCDYCCNDVIATEALFDHLKEDFAAREILAKLSGLTVNDSTQTHAARIIFGKDPHPQDKFVYTDLSKMFPGYKYEAGKSTYRGVEVGEGGYVYAEPGMYFNVALLDIASMHPSSLINLNLFGPYTKNFVDIKDSRVAVKHQDMEKIKTLLDGKLYEVLQENPDLSLESLGYSMKIVINMIYGFTSATFDSKFRDPRNVDNIVAKRGALFMVNLQMECQKRGWKVAHIKTDSIKLPNATPEMIQFVMDYGRQYGYEFEHEATYDRMCLVNDAVYIAKYDSMGIRNKGGKHANEWTATGAQFAHPYVFKKCFSKEAIQFEDLCEKRAATSNIYIDVREGLPDVSFAEATQDGYRSALNKWRKGNFKEGEKEKFLRKYNLFGVGDEYVEETLLQTIRELDENIAPGHNYIFVGKVGLFCPMKSGCGAGVLVREKDGKYYSVTDTLGYLWMESEMVKRLHLEDKINMSYFAHKVDDAIANIAQYGDFEMFVEGPPVPPWNAPDGSAPSWVLPF